MPNDPREARRSLSFAAEQQDDCRQFAEAIELRRKIDGQQVAIALQPIVSAGAFSLHHYEALARFHGGPGTAATVALAEQTGLVLDLDLLVLKQVCRLLHEVSRCGPVPSIAVNLSASSFESDSFLSALEDLLAQQGPLRQQVVLEITESTGLTDLARAARVIEQLRGQGHLICLDDFGVGAASFPYLHALAVDWVKLDRHYVQRLPEDRRAEAILRSMIGLCRELGVGTIAEGVETREQLHRLQELGADCFQGYLLGRPVTQPDPASLALTKELSSRFNA